jgi:hypothetical protein
MTPKRSIVERIAMKATPVLVRYHGVMGEKESIGQVGRVYHVLKEVNSVLPYVNPK